MRKLFADRLTEDGERSDIRSICWREACKNESEKYTSEIISTSPRGQSI